MKAVVCFFELIGARTLISAFLVFIFVLPGVRAQSFSLREELIYPVNPPRKVVAPTARVIPWLEARHDTPPSTASGQYLEALQVWFAAQSLIRAGKAPQAVAILENARDRLVAIQKNHPDFQSRQVALLLAKVLDACKAAQP